MNYVLENWGSFVGVLGLAITIVGAIFSIAAFKRAGKAKEAAEAAEIASQETQEGITKVLTIVDMERAIGLITRLKTFHRSNNWGAAIEH